jgi:hypothetical protein
MFYTTLLRKRNYLKVLKLDLLMQIHEIWKCMFESILYGIREMKNGERYYI